MLLFHLHGLLGGAKRIGDGHFFVSQLFGLNSTMK
jgi:hypothetical protein